MKTAILITYDEEDVISEAIALCDSAGYRVPHIIKQKFLKRQKFGISEEIVTRLEEIVKKYRADVVVFDEILKPSQNYNLASKLHKNILDREALILEIFESRASSSESKLQVKLAKMRYEMLRAKEKVRLAKKGEQPGFLGIGKFGVDVYYNDIKHRMKTVKSKLKKAGKQRELHRQARKRHDFKMISLAGYTSAGKTTLFNKLTGEQRQEGDELFTTLTTMIRRFTIKNKVFLISDTVGFISKLPAYMIEAFKSTLEELLYVDIVILIIDVNDSLFTLKKKFASCKKTLSEIGVEQDNIVYVFNKADLQNKNEIFEKIEYLGLTGSKKWIPVSAKTGQNTKQLKEFIENVTESRPRPDKQRKTHKEELEKIYGN
ncbi:MAG: GTPase HflX [Nitrosopumilaceae archaeon]